MTEQCSYEVLQPGFNFSRFRQCKNKAVMVHNGKPYCGIHRPESVSKRKKKREETIEKNVQTRINLYYAKLKAKNRTK